jgi:MFS superfamily sulfate permease-like transporter
LGILVGCVGILFIAAGLLRLGFVAAFVSRPVLRGFAIGLAASIILRQFFAVTGVPMSGSSLVEQVVAVLQHASEWNLLALATASVALTFILLLRAYTSIPAAFGVLAVAVVLSLFVDFQRIGIPVIGDIGLSISWPVVPRLGLHQWLSVISASLPLGLVVFVESWGTSRTLALRHGDALDPDRELVAIGVANVASASVGGQAVGAGFSASSANEASGASNRSAGAVSALVLGAFILFGLPLIARVPAPILAAVVVAALLHALDPRPILQLWRIDRDQYLALIGALGVLLLGALYGMLLAVGLSVLAIVRRLAEPSVVRLGQLNGGRDYVDTARHPEAICEPAILVVRPGEPLFFANAERIMSRIEDMATGNVRFLVVSLELSDDLDSTSLEVLGESAIRLHARGQELQLGRVKDPVRELMSAAGGRLALLAAGSSRSVADAVASARAKLSQGKQS